MARRFQWRTPSPGLTAGFPEEPDEVEPRSGWETFRQVGSVGMIVLIIAVLVGLVATGGGSSSVEPPAERAGSAASRTLAPVPDVRGKTQAEAVRILREAGFEGTISVSRPDKRVATGLVANQVPAPGTKALTGSTVELALSLGTSDPLVPNIIGSPLNEAVAALERAGLSYVAAAEASDQPVGTVLRVAPAVGTPVPRGTKVALMLSGGPNAWDLEQPPALDAIVTEVDTPVRRPSPGQGTTGASPQVPSQPVGTVPTSPVTRPPTTRPPTTRPPTTSPPATQPPPTAPPTAPPPPPTSPPTTSCIWVFPPSGPELYCS